MALNAGIFLGCANFLYAGLSSRGFISLSYVGLTAFIIIAIYRLNQCIRNKINTGSIIDMNTSNFVDTENGNKFKYSNIIPLCGNGFTNLFSLFMMTYAFKYAAIAGIN